MLEGCILAVSRQSKTTPQNSSYNSVPGAPNRISFAKLREPLEVPGLLDVQIDSFEWLIGSPHWREAAAGRGDVTPVGGLEEANVLGSMCARVGRTAASAEIPEHGS